MASDIRRGKLNDDPVMREVEKATIRRLWLRNARFAPWIFLAIAATCVTSAVITHDDGLRMLDCFVVAIAPFAALQQWLLVRGAKKIETADA